MSHRSRTRPACAPLELRRGEPAVAWERHGDERALPQSSTRLMLLPLSGKKGAPMRTSFLLLLALLGLAGCQSRGREYNLSGVYVGTEASPPRLDSHGRLGGDG